MAVAFEFVRNALFSVAAGIWISSLAWVIADARLRLAKAREVHAATALVGLMPIAGLLAWLVVRPETTLAERWSAELVGLLHAEASESGECPVCGSDLDGDFRYCSSCGIELERPGAPDPVEPLRTAAR